MNILANQVAAAAATAAAEEDRQAFERSVKLELSTAMAERDAAAERASESELQVTVYPLK
jgi:hypothetical protein